MGVKHTDPRGGEDDNPIGAGVPMAGLRGGEAFSLPDIPSVGSLESLMPPCLQELV